MISIADVDGFDWDAGNIDKNRDRHGVSNGECEEPFFSQPLLVTDDVKHSHREQRFYALGQTNAGRRLFIVFTIRDNKIRVISARDMSRKERKIYAQVTS
jgi:uncharacterized DUF497 family protein